MYPMYPGDELSARLNNEIFNVKRFYKTKLELDDWGLSTFPLEILELDWLEELNLSNNSIEFLPEGIGALKNLKILNLNNNSIKQIPAAIGKLKKLQQLGLHFNEIEHLPRELFDLESLSVLGLNKNRITKITDKIKKLKQLIMLGLADNNITHLPFEVIRLPRLTSLQLKGNPLKTPPLEVALSANNITSIKSYFLELNKSESKDFLNEIKLLIVGNGGVGKTTLARKLTDIKYEFDRFHNSTLGINISTWSVPKEHFDQTSNHREGSRKINSDLRINVWDFGGQEIYYATHQFFLTKRSIYFLLTESRREDKYEDFNYWLNIIELLGHQSPVIIVQGKCDQPTKDLPIKEFKRRFKNIIGFPVKVSCYPGEEPTIHNLKFELFRIITDKKLTPLLGSVLPKAWIRVKEKLEDIRNTRNHINIEEYFNICSKFHLEKKAALFLSDYLHDLGIILHFQDEIELNDIVILNYEWATKGVYLIIHNQTILDNKGRFDDEDLLKIWDGVSYKTNKRELLALMKKFEICFEISKRKYLAPQLLPSDEPEFNFDEISASAEGGKSKLRLSYRYEFMPSGIIPRLIVKLNEMVVNSYYWRFGVILKYEKTYALISGSNLKNRISILIRGHHRKEVLGIIRSAFSEIHNSFKNLTYFEEIPCGCKYSLEAKEPHFFKVRNLNRRLERKVKTVECEECFEVYNVVDILEGTSIREISSVVKNLVENNRVKESLTLLEDRLKTINDYNLYNQVVLLSARFHRLKDDRLKDLINRNDYDVKLNEIVLSSIAIANEIDRIVISENPF